MTGLALLAVAAAILALGAGLFVDNVGAIATRLSVPATAVALIVAGAEPEELVTSVLASRAGRPGLAAGDAIGASVTATTLVLGLAILAGVAVMDRAARRFARWAAAATALAALALADGRLDRVEGVVLVMAYAPIVAAALRHRGDPGPVVADTALMVKGKAVRPGNSVLLGLAGVVAMTVGGWIAVVGAERAARALDRTDGAIGLTLLALATSAELLALVWAAARRRRTELLVAAVLGSAAFNTTLTLGAAALVHPGPTTDVPGSALVLTLLVTGLAVAAVTRSGLSRWLGVGLLGGYVVFITSTLSSSTWR